MTDTLGLNLDTASLSTKAKLKPGISGSGDTVTITGTGFDGDRQVNVAFGSETRQVDVINGTITVTFTAPDAKLVKVVNVIAKGLQSGVVAKTAYAVHK
nr:IPT/TIG domain-containing protein [Microbacterium sp. 4R-513]